MPRYFELDVALQEIQPRIWRRFLIRTTSTFAQLHKAIQQNYGWWDNHLWEFRLPTIHGKPIAGLPTDDDFGRPTPDAREVKLSSYFTGKHVTEWCEYLYDFGDSWCHDVKLIRVVSDKESFKQRLLAGDRACPPEDCGGVSGFERMVHFVQTGEDILNFPIPAQAGPGTRLGRARPRNPEAGRWGPRCQLQAGRHEAQASDQARSGF